MTRKKKRGDFPRFSLREKIQKRKKENNQEEHNWDWDYEEDYREPKDLWTRFPLSNLVYMHKYLWEKTLAIVVLLIFVYLLSFFSFPLAVTVREKIYDTTTEHMNLPGYSRHLESVFKGMSEIYPFGFLEEKTPEEPEALEQGKEKQLDFVLPIQGVIAGKFGLRDDPFTGISQMYYGVDLMGPSEGTVVSVETGKVKGIYQDNIYGQTVEVEHQKGFNSVYSGLGEIIVDESDPVEKGQTIGFLKEEDNPLLHFQIRKLGHPVDPLDYFPGTS
ncbi:M23 family metallopeptidase [Candidatus Contubernalis alkaliaceticus]|uniref:M23 family metallopeptidase n=1 Tax=Candidatus Contubernalis alkaliaceticus TaxID=338645 RepID=UPI001F4C19E5|nr:M23 family metallopeptidase [Candidatus Contubernalis alkalaceticus]UNC90924.1 M23 family metallopeptidase [Candidatus Contubernalis alkalaceticus]